MNALLLLLKPNIRQRIASRAQRFIFKRTTPRQPFRRILVMEMTPAPRITLEIIPGQIYVDTLQEIRRITYRFSGMTPPEWDAYWQGKKNGCAITIQDVAKVPKDQQQNPLKFYGLYAAPQNFVYVPMPQWPLGRPGAFLALEDGPLFFTEKED